MMKKRSEFGLGSAFFDDSDPGLVKKTFFKVFFPKKSTRGPGDEILEIFVMGSPLVPFFLGPHDAGGTVVPCMGGDPMKKVPVGGLPPWKGTRDYQGCLGGAQGCG